MLSKKEIIWVAPFALLGIVFALVPLFGFMVHGGRHDQWVFLVLLAGWLASIGCTVACFVMIFATPGKSTPLRVTMAVLTLVFLALTSIGFTGFRDGFFELVAG